MHPQDTAQRIADFAERSQRQRRGAGARKPKPLGGLLAQLLATRNYAAKQSNADLAAAWAAAAGPALARFSRAVRVNAGRLEVMVANSTMMQELTFEKQRILTAVRAAMPGAKISDLKLRVGKL